MSQGTEFHGRAAAPAHPGRHRRGGAESWTPPLPPHRPVRHHAAGAAPEPGSWQHGATGGAYAVPPRIPAGAPDGGHLPRPHPAEQATPGFSGRLTGPEVGDCPFREPTTEPDPPVSGLLPLPQPRDPRPATVLFPAAHGSLPLGTFGDAGDSDPDEEPVAESHAEQVARRTRVSLAAPAPRCVDLDDDDVRIYSAPPIDGLGGFTIGSVPASVTPPKTWRKAAWFATGASGAVVVGLLCAGSFLVGKPPMDQAVQGSWPGYQGVPTIGDPTGEHRPPTQGGSAPGLQTPSPTDHAAGKPQGGGAGPVDGAAPPPVGDTAGPDPATTGPAAPSATPRKPAVTPAQRETPVKPPWWYSFPPDAQTMGDNSEKFFNTVTTDPAAASSVTTGSLHDQGPQALADRYAGIAYFEVKKVSIDQQRGVTVNTVEVTHTDGTKTIEQRTLTFGDGDKITADGQ
ncbi:hypothetical protein ACWEGE_38005 [Amycolatopsis sp. NPDC004747]